LLVDPGLAGRPDGQMIVRGKAVVPDLAAAHEREPSILGENVGQPLGEDGGEGRDDDDREGVVGNRLQQAGRKHRCGPAAAGADDLVVQRLGGAPSHARTREAAELGLRLRQRLPRDPAAPHPENHSDDQYRNDDEHDPPNHEVPPGRLSGDFNSQSMGFAPVGAILREASQSHQFGLRVAPAYYLKASKKAKTAGTRMTTNIAGKMKRISGKSIFTGALCARSSAFARRRLRMSFAMFRRI
jgi:hypothetical protein